MKKGFVVGLFSIIAPFALSLLPGCPGSKAEKCSWGAVCPPGEVCHEPTEQCVLARQVSACLDKNEYEPCEYPGSPLDTVCRNGICIIPRCGDSIVDQGEDCDGENLGDATCESLGMGEGTLVCNTNCTFDTSGCNLGSVCGNNVREDSEVCDGEDLGEETCVSQGYYEGTLGCLSDCTDFDVSACNGYCGDGEINGDEVCDGLSLAGETCESQGFYEGTLGCLSDCTDFDVSACNGYCGDGEINGNEACDGDDLGGMEKCSDFGCRSNGVVTCNEDCTFNFSDCLSGYDESGDGIDDNCDNCPGYYNPDQADTNGDGIGDVCEAPGNDDLISSIVVFDPFLNHENSWFVWEGGTWNHGPHYVSGSAVLLGGSYLHDHQLPDGPYAVETTFYHSGSALIDSNWAGISFAMQNLSGAASGYFCAIDRKTLNLGILRLEPGNSNWSQLAGAIVNSTAADHHWKKIHVFYDGGGLTCVYHDETGAFEMIQLSANQTADDLTGHAGLRVFNENAVFRSFAIYE